MKKLITLVGGLALAAGLNAQSVPMPALSAPVTVHTDANGIPTIVGDTEHDVNYVRGFLHARDRLFQMDYLRRVASGTLAELLGEGALSSDIELRTLGLRRGALETWQHMNADEKAWVKAYSDGVNAFLAAADQLPPEYGALELTQVERWSPVDSLIIGKLLAFQLSFDSGVVDRTIRLANYQGVGDAAGFDGMALFSEDLSRSAPMDDRLSIPNFFESAGIVQVPGSKEPSLQSEGGESSASGGWQNVPQLDDAVVDSLSSYMERVRNIPLLGTTVGRAENRAGSNWWVVSGEHTESGFPVMANDPHLGLDMPALMINENIVIRDEERVVSGVNPPGTPLTLLGCNLNICWGLTNHNIDVTDYFQEDILTNSYGLPTHTVHEDGEESVLYAFQSYFVNGVGDGEMDNVNRANVGYDAGGITFLVPRRNNGPIVAQPDASSAISVQYAGWGATFELSTLRGFERASNMEEFRAAIDNWTFGSQNVAYADVEGNIAYFTTGAVPLREDLQNNNVGGGVPPFLLRDGSGALGHDWLPANEDSPRAAPFASLPKSEMPHVVNPPWGYIANANNDPVGTTLDNNPLNQLRPDGNGIYYLNPSYSGLRMARIDRELQDMIAAGPVSVDQMKALQANNQMFDAELLVPHILEAFENATGEDAWPGLAQFALDPGVQEAIGRLAEWDFSTPTGLAAGWDPGSPAGSGEPSAEEVANSVAATIYSVWRGQVIGNTIDATLEALQLGDHRPGSSDALRAFHNLLANFDENGGFGASGVPFFNVEEAPDMASARDTILLASLAQSLELLASDEFAPAFANSTDQSDYRWGKLHRIVFSHPLGSDPFNVPNGGGLSDVGEGLPGVARAGGYQTVDAASHSVRADGVNDFMFGSGPARRTVAEMTPGTPNVSEVLPGGRSGVLVSPFYTNQLRLWLVNDYLPLSFGESGGQSSAVDSTTFTP
ncbi:MULTISPECIES: penicillin acylase family protein [unclassified Wenzhouxiangella]|uniref:penicillin acylase family protein n=1 Tax=unclassified Wenzhouxiangella TaxID=2613841 RepID=UPI000E329868|nr:MULTISPECIES: penicillin acylase family protein [unclassified Wenzhouxiangella]RFF28690.1 penicillin acylase family protein [Wenzhouxiangella sp. 15181]RFP70253.1 penicillin acylase family protein [Wenzhouxiangella sp. 15190]